VLRLTRSLDGVHVANPAQQRDLLNIVLLGTTVELSWLMDPRTYKKKGPDGTEPRRASEIECWQRAFAIRCYQKFMAVFSDRQDLLVGFELHNPSTLLFDPMFHRLAVTLYKYKLRQSAQDGTFHWAELRHNILRHTLRFHASLKDIVERDMGVSSEELDICKSFEWDGPQFRVIRKSDKVVSKTGMQLPF
jgi:hypothetical protein